MALGLMAAAGVALVCFDLGPPVALNDDWMFAWTARRLVEGHGLQKVPGLIPYGLVHVLWGVAANLGHPGTRSLRLTELPFLVLTGWAVWRLCRELGAGQGWAGVGTATVVCSPLVLNLTSGFQSDVPYLALLTTATLAGVRWVRSGEMRLTCTLLLLLAFLERQTAVLLLPALTAGLLRSRRGRGRVAVSDWAHLALAGAAVVGGAAAAQALGMSGAAAATLLDLAHGPSVRNLVAGVLFLPAMLGLGVLPFAVPLAWATWHAGRSLPAGSAADHPSRRLRNAVAFGASVSGLAILVGFTLARLSFFPGDHLSPYGLGPALLAGDKPQLYPTPAFLLLEACALIAFFVLVNWWRVANRGTHPDPDLRRFVAMVAGFQLLTLLQGSFDRYFVPTIVLLVPLVVSSFPTLRPPARVRLWAPAVIALGLGAFVVGEQDYLAWQWARDAAAKQAYALAPPSRVDAGFEANGVYWELPTYERLGLPRGTAALGPRQLPSLGGPPHPRYRLLFAAPDDPRPGVSYRSLAPGRIILAP